MLFGCAPNEIPNDWSNVSKFIGAIAREHRFSVITPQHLRALLTFLQFSHPDVQTSAKKSSFRREIQARIRHPSSHTGLEATDDAEDRRLALPWMSALEARRNRAASLA